MDFSGVRAHDQNGFHDNIMKPVTCTYRDVMLSVVINWPGNLITDIFSFKALYEIWLHNWLPHYYVHQLSLNMFSFPKFGRPW